MLVTSYVCLNVFMGLCCTLFSCCHPPVVVVKNHHILNCEILFFVLVSLFCLSSFCLLPSFLSYLLTCLQKCPPCIVGFLAKKIKSSALTHKYTALHLPAPPRPSITPSLLHSLLSFAALLYRSSTLPSFLPSFLAPFLPSVLPYSLA